MDKQGQPVPDDDAHLGTLRVRYRGVPVVLSAAAVLILAGASLVSAMPSSSAEHVSHRSGEGPSGSASHTSVHTVGTGQQRSDSHGGHTMPTPGPLPPAIPNSESGDFVEGSPFQDPPKIASRKGQLKVTLTANSIPVRISGKLVNARVYGAKAYGKTYAPSYVPPTLIVDPGDTVTITLVNNLPEPTNIHTHGWFVSPMGNQDNIYVTVPEGKTVTYQYLVPKSFAPGSYWYHPHEHGLVEEQVFGGLAGFIHVRGMNRLLPEDLRQVKKHYIMLKDMQLNKGNSIINTNIDSAKPTNRFVNGLKLPTMTMKPGETQIWHIANMSADIWYTLAASGMSFSVLAEDGNPVGTPWTVSELEIAPGKRFDVVVRAPQSGGTTLQTVQMSTGPAGDTYPTVDLMTIALSGPAQPAIALPETVRPDDAKYWVDLNTKEPAQQRTFVLTEDKNGFYINGKEWRPHAIAATPLKGTVEEWTFINETREDHPIHIHVNDMQVISINGEAQDADWVDTQKIPAVTKDASGNKVPGTVVVRMDFRRYPGVYVFHCHILNHEDNGMMANVSVTTKPSLPPTLPQG